MLAAGLARGSRASIVAAFGCTLGIEPHMAAALFGLAAVLHARSPSPRSNGASASPMCAQHVITRPKVMQWLRRSFAAGFAALGPRLAFADR